MKKRNTSLENHNIRLTNKKILLIITGSIAAYKAGDLIKDLRDAGAEVTCVLTKAAEHFVTHLTIRAISGQPVYGDLFDLNTPYSVLHTALAEETDVVLVAPASADYIAKLATGRADDLGSCVILATRCPVIIAPAMNDQMYLHSLTQRNIKTLRDIGYLFVDPIEGDLVCGKTAVGHVSDSERIITGLKAALKK